MPGRIVVAVSDAIIVAIVMTMMTTRQIIVLHQVGQYHAKVHDQANEYHGVRDVE